MKGKEMNAPFDVIEHRFPVWEDDYQTLKEEGEKMLAKYNINQTWDIRKYTGKVGHCPFKALEAAEKYLEDVFNLAGVTRKPEKGIDPGVVKDLQDQIKKLKELLQEKDRHLSTLTDILGMLRGKEIPDEVEIV